MHSHQPSPDFSPDQPSSFIKKPRNPNSDHRSIPSWPDQLTMALYVETSLSPLPTVTTRNTLVPITCIVSCQSCVAYTMFVQNSVLLQQLLTAPTGLCQNMFWHKPAGAVRSCCNNEFPARSIASVLLFTTSDLNDWAVFLFSPMLLLLRERESSREGIKKQVHTKIIKLNVLRGDVDQNVKDQSDTEWQFSFHF